MTIAILGGKGRRMISAEKHRCVAGHALLVMALVVFTPSAGARPAEVGEEAGLLGQAESWDYGPAMREVASKFTGTGGVVLHLGDSITFASPYTAWARNGRGKTSEDEAVLTWSHCGEQNDLDGWHLASREVGEFWSHTAAGGIRADQFLAGGYAGLPSLADIIQAYHPQVAVVMLGTNDAWQGRSAEAYAADMDAIVGELLRHGTVPILSTIPPMPPAPELGEQYNAALWQLAQRHELPVIDFCGEIIARGRGGRWNGTLLQKDDPHPGKPPGERIPAARMAVGEEANGGEGEGVECCTRPTARSRRLACGNSLPAAR
jgi:lysophospholipase L1-like esterase